MSPGIDPMQNEAWANIKICIEIEFFLQLSTFVILVENNSFLWVEYTDLSAD